VARSISTTWASDASPSMPVPPKVDRMIPMGGFVFTVNGLSHDLSEIEAEAISTPFFTPPRGRG
jgi:hypothetical protein